MTIISLFVLLQSGNIFAKKPAKPAVFNLSGSIIDKETQEDLAGAFLYFEKLHKGVYSGPDGTFNIDGIEPGNYKVTVKFISYHDKQISVKVEKSKNNYTKILLEPVQP